MERKRPRSRRRTPAISQPREVAPPPKLMTQWSYRHWCDHAEQLASVRSDCWCQSQLAILDELIERLGHMYEESPTFDFDWWCDKAHWGFGRATTHTRARR